MKLILTFFDIDISQGIHNQEKYFLLSSLQRRSLKYTSLRTSFLGIIFGFLIFPCYGMLPLDEDPLKIDLKNKKSKGFSFPGANYKGNEELMRTKRRRISSLSEWERNNQEDNKKRMSLPPLHALNEESPFLKIPITEHLIDGEEHNLIGQYNLGKSVHLSEKNNKLLLDQDPSRQFIKERAKIFYDGIHSSSSHTPHFQKRMGILYLKEGPEKNVDKAFAYLHKGIKAFEGNEFKECGLTDFEAPQIANLLSKATHLRAINLEHNKFTSQGLGTILDSLHLHDQLNELNISHNYIDKEGGKKLLNFFENKRYLNLLIVYENSLKASTEIELNKMINKRLDEYVKQSYICHK